MKEIRNAPWELVSKENMNPVSNGEVWGTLYRFPIWTEVPAGATVTDGWSQKHTAPSADGLYTLYQYVQDACLMGFKWEGTQQ
jgi:hypothetical protein